jgi:hypothetical protein
MYTIKTKQIYRESKPGFESIRANEEDERTRII